MMVSRSLIMLVLFSFFVLSNSQSAGHQEACAFLRRYLQLNSLSRFTDKHDDLRSVYHHLLTMYRIIKEFPQQVFLKSERALYFELKNSHSPSHLLGRLLEFGENLSEDISNGHCQKLDSYFKKVVSNLTHSILVFSSVLPDHADNEDELRVCLSKVESLSKYSLRANSVNKWIKLSFSSCAELSRLLKRLQFHLNILLEVRKLQQSDLCRRGVQRIIQQCSPYNHRLQCCSSCAFVIDQCIGPLSSIAKEAKYNFFVIEEFRKVLQGIWLVFGGDFHMQMLSQATTGNKLMKEEATDAITQVCAGWPVTPEEAAELRAEDSRQEAYLRRFVEHRLTTPLPAVSLQSSLEELRRAHTAILASLQRIDELAQLVKQHFGQTCPKVAAMGGETGPRVEADEEHVSQNDQALLAEEVLTMKPINLIYEDNVNLWVEDYDLQPEVDYADAPDVSTGEGEPREEEVQTIKPHSNPDGNRASPKGEEEGVFPTTQSDRRQVDFAVRQTSSSPRQHHKQNLCVFVAVFSFHVLLPLIAPA